MFEGRGHAVHFRRSQATSRAKSKDANASSQPMAVVRTRGLMSGWREIGFNYGLTRVNQGGTAADFTQNGGDPTSGAHVAGNRNGFAAAIGGGMDIPLGHFISVKPIQLEYLMTQDPSPFTQVNHTQNNLRYSAGIVFRFGAAR